MKIATTTGDFSKYYASDIDRIRGPHKAGFRYIDLDMYSFTPDCVYMNDGWEKAVDELKAEAERLEMTFVQAHSQGGNPLDPDPAHVNFLVDATNRSIEICQRLGVKNTVVHSGFAKEMSKEDKNKQINLAQLYLKAISATQKEIAAYVSAVLNGVASQYKLSYKLYISAGKFLEKKLGIKATKPKKEKEDKYF